MLPGSGPRGTSGDMAEALPSCYHGAISKKACEDLLGRKDKDGAFLIRDSETIQGALCLCVYKQKVVYTYRLLRTHSGDYTILGSEGVQQTSFKSLEDLIRHYQRRNQGLATPLRCPVCRKTATMVQPAERGETLKRRDAREGPRAVPPLRPPRPPPARVQSGLHTPDSDDYVEVLPY